MTPNLLISYDFITSSTTLQGEVFYNYDKSLSLCCVGQVKQTAEQIINLYELYGEYFVEHLQGLYICCLYDATKKRIVVVRDRLGVQQLYYAQLPTGVVFGSSLKEVLQHIKHPQLRAHELAQPIRHNYPIELQHTWIEQIKRLGAGEYALVDACGLRLYTYWKRNHTVTFQGTKEEAIEAFCSFLKIF